ncbi:MAG: hypothetical protein OJF50_003188 [Nitrospira sp.]|nr:hypothetical protein [Nitrospira sp.]
MILVWMKNPVYRVHMRSYVSSHKFLSGDSFGKYQMVIGRY